MVAHLEKLTLIASDTNSSTEKGNLPKVKVLPPTKKAAFSLQDNTLTNSALLCSRFQ